MESQTSRRNPVALAARMDAKGLDEVGQRSHSSLDAPHSSVGRSSASRDFSSAAEGIAAGDELSSIAASDARQDIDVMLWSMRLCSIRRYFHQRFWELETRDAEYASRVEPMPRLETVAEHSWHVADAVLLFAARFPYINAEHCVVLAVLHDKMEIIIGDHNPVGRDGTGLRTHAFNVGKQLSKADAERTAIEQYLSQVHPIPRQSQEQALRELMEGKTWESKFIKAIDKLQALAFVLVKKAGDLSDKHLEFTLRYSEKVLHYFPGLEAHYAELRGRLLAQVARHRHCAMRSILDLIYTRQLNLRFDDEEI